MGWGQAQKKDEYHDDQLQTAVGAGVVVCVTAVFKGSLLAFCTEGLEPELYDWVGAGTKETWVPRRTDTHCRWCRCWCCCRVSKAACWHPVPSPHESAL